MKSVTTEPAVYLTDLSSIPTLSPQGSVLHYTHSSAGNTAQSEQYPDRSLFASHSHDYPECASVSATHVSVHHPLGHLKNLSSGASGLVTVCPISPPTFHVAPIAAPTPSGPSSTNSTSTTILQSRPSESWSFQQQQDSQGRLVFNHTASSVVTISSGGSGLREGISGYSKSSSPNLQNPGEQTKENEESTKDSTKESSKNRSSRETPVLLQSIGVSTYSSHQPSFSATVSPMFSPNSNSTSNIVSPSAPNPVLNAGTVGTMSSVFRPVNNSGTIAGIQLPLTITATPNMTAATAKPVIITPAVYTTISPRAQSKSRNLGPTPPLSGPNSGANSPQNAGHPISVSGTRKNAFTFPTSTASSSASAAGSGLASSAPVGSWISGAANSPPASATAAVKNDNNLAIAMVSLSNRGSPVAVESFRTIGHGNAFNMSASSSSSLSSSSSASSSSSTCTTLSPGIVSTSRNKVGAHPLATTETLPNSSASNYSNPANTNPNEEFKHFIPNTNAPLNINTNAPAHETFPDGAADDLPQETEIADAETAQHADGEETIQPAIFPPLNIKHRRCVRPCIQITSGHFSMQGIRQEMEDKVTLLPHPEFNRLAGISEEMDDEHRQQHNQSIQQQGINHLQQADEQKRNENEIEKSPKQADSGGLAVSEVPRSFFAVFDGHGGDVSAEYSHQHVHINFLQEQTFGTDYGEALKNAIKRTDEDFCNACRRINLLTSSGTTAVCAYIDCDLLVVANVGDSRAVLCRNGKALQVSNDHKPGRKDERARVEKLGGRVGTSEEEAFGLKPQSGCCACLKRCFEPKKPLRVFPGGLSVSRTIGDISMKATSLIISDPEVFHCHLQPADTHLILACVPHDHQILTRCGFVNYSQMKKLLAKSGSIEVASYDPVNERLVYETIQTDAIVESTTKAWIDVFRPEEDSHTVTDSGSHSSSVEPAAGSSRKPQHVIRMSPDHRVWVEYATNTAANGNYEFAVQRDSTCADDVPKKANEVRIDAEQLLTNKDILAYQFTSAASFMNDMDWRGNCLDITDDQDFLQSSPCFAALRSVLDSRDESVSVELENSFMRFPSTENLLPISSTSHMKKKAFLQLYGSWLAVRKSVAAGIHAVFSSANPSGLQRIVNRLNMIDVSFGMHECEQSVECLETAVNTFFSAESELMEKNSAALPLPVWLWKLSALQKRFIIEGMIWATGDMKNWIETGTVKIEISSESLRDELIHLLMEAGYAADYSCTQKNSYIVRGSEQLRKLTVPMDKKTKYVVREELAEPALSWCVRLPQHSSHRIFVRPPPLDGAATLPLIVNNCDGVWDVITNQAAVDVVKKHGDDAESGARALAREAYRKGSTDNISVVVVHLIFPDRYCYEGEGGVVEDMCDAITKEIAETAPP